MSWLGGGEAIENGRCKGRKPLREEGQFVGMIEFHGELDFADASATRAEGGGSSQHFRIVCKKRKRGRASANPYPGAALSRIVAASVVPGVATYFSALTRVPDIKPGATWEFGAARIETFSRIRIT